MRTIHKEIPLSVKGLKDAARSLSALAKSLDERDLFSENMRDAALQLLLEDLNDNIAAITDTDGNPIGATSIRHVGGESELRWSGDHILFIEFGTGVTGMGEPYPDPTIMAVVDYEYHQYHGPNKREWWEYENKLRDSGLTRTWGMPAHAPMYNVFLSADSTLTAGAFGDKVAELFEGVVGKVFQ